MLKNRNKKKDNADINYIGNCKLKISVVNKLIRAKASKHEISFVLYCATYQNTLGNIQVYYKDCLEYLKISKSQFYTILKTLEAKDIIEIRYNAHTQKGYIDILIKDNMFISTTDFKAYITIHRDIFHIDEFKRMKAFSMLLLLKLIGVHRVGHSKKYKEKTLMEWLGIKKEYSIRKYIEEIQEFYKVHKIDREKETVYVFTAKEKCEYKSNSEKTNYFFHKLRYILKSNRISLIREKVTDNFYHYMNLTEEHIKELVGLFNQYADVNKLVMAITKCMLQRRDSNGIDIKPSISGKYINFLYKNWDFNSDSLIVPSTSKN
jgi:hypothetical protein